MTLERACALIGTASIFLRGTMIYLRRISLPDGVRIHINDISIIEVLVPDQCVRREYQLHKD
jgi:hypothetical protein